MTQAWTPEEVKTDVGEGGDILAPLKRVYDTYLKHRDRILSKALQQNRNFTEAEVRGVEYYQLSAGCVRELINQ